MNKNKRLLIIFLCIPLLLMIPLIGMQFSTEVNWGIFDFVIMGFLLLITGLMFELVFRKVRKKDNRIVIIAIILIIFFLIWAELAVGIFGSPLAGS